MRVGDDYLRISPTGNFTSVQEIGDVLIGASDKPLVRLSDFATITWAYEEEPKKLYYINGKPGLSIGISMAAGENVVEVGRAVNRKIASLQTVIPVGMAWRWCRCTTSLRKSRNPWVDSSSVSARRS